MTRKVIQQRGLMNFLAYLGCQGGRRSVCPLWSQVHVKAGRAFNSWGPSHNPWEVTKAGPEMTARFNHEFRSSGSAHGDETGL